MRIGRILAAGAAVALLGAAALLARAPGRVPEPSGQYRVTEQDLALRTDQGSYRVRLWQPQGNDRALPLILYAPGWGNRADDAASLLADFASHGYIVAAFDDLALDPVRPGETETQTGVRLAQMRLDSPEAYRKSFATASARVGLAARKGQAVLGGLLADRRVGGRIDPARIGFLGYSFGGAAGVEQAVDDRRIKAVANLDGWLFGKSAQAVPDLPYLLVYIDEDFPPQTWLTSSSPGERALALGCQFDHALHRALLARPDFHWVRFPGMNHEDLSDRRFDRNWLQSLRSPSGTDDVFLTRKRNQAVVVRDFFDRYLKGQGAAGGLDSSLSSPVREADLLPPAQGGNL